MVFIGIKNDQERANVIKYLQIFKLNKKIQKMIKLKILITTYFTNFTSVRF